MLHKTTWSQLGIVSVQLFSILNSKLLTWLPSSLARVTSAKSPLAPRYLKEAAAVSSNLFQQRLILSPSILLPQQLDNDWRRLFSDSLLLVCLTFGVRVRGCQAKEKSETVAQDAFLTDVFFLKRIKESWTSFSHPPSICYYSIIVSLDSWFSCWLFLFANQEIQKINGQKKRFAVAEIWINKS